MKPTLIFCHGFALSPNFWDNLLPYFDQYSVESINLGYVGLEYSTDFSIFDKNKIYIGIGHSLGLSVLLKSELVFSHLIGLNGFINFLGYNPKLQAKRKLELALLKRSFQINPQKTLQAFYKRVGVGSFNEQETKFNFEEIEQAFSQLEEEFQLPQSTQTLIIGAEDDIIVPTDIIQDNFANQQNAKLVILPRGGHALGFKQNKEVSTLITDFIYGEV